MSQNMKTKLIRGQILEFSNDEDLIVVWFSRTTQCFCIQLNAIVIDSLKTFPIFELKLKNLLKRKEIDFEPKEN